MIFGKIDYINLLPFHTFLKKSNMQNALKKACEYRKSYPSAINARFEKRRIDAAIISSIQSGKKGIRTLDMGIVAKKNVRSVVVEKNTQNASDPHSATSNMLAKVLQIHGKVLIGDKALQAYLQEPDHYIDLAQIWYEKYHLPFVFARLSINRYFHFYKRISDRFKKYNIKIPSYVINQYSQERGIKVQDIKQYLALISYDIGAREKRSLQLFFKKSKQFTKN
ncbi:MAG: menaquinone via futalosine step 1 [Sulfurospirillum sp.]|nr:menaquinone via futalosine step 1 [Sulfurospirillum sp.]